jgi:hypothetical protein
MSGERASVPAVVEVAWPMRTPSLRNKLAVPAAIASAGDHVYYLRLDRTDGVGC